MPTIRKLPSGNFQAVVRLNNLKPLYATFPTKTKARQWAQAVETDTALARKLGPTNDLSLEQAVQIQSGSRSITCLVPTFSSWADLFLQQSTMKDDSAKGRIKFWKAQFSDRLVTDIQPEDIDEILHRLAKRSTGSNVNRYKSNLSSVFIAFNKHPTYKRLKHPNPVRSEFVSSFPENPPKNRFLSPVEQKSLLEAARESHWERLYLLVLMALTTGARRGELMQLSWNAINREERVAYLKNTKNGQPRLIPLIEPVLKELMQFNEAGDALIFGSPVNPLKPFDFKKAWQKALRDAGISELRFHDLRHTAASNMVANNRTLFETGTLLGHRQSNTTMRYAHLAHHHTTKMAEEVWSRLHE